MHSIVNGHGQLLLQVTSEFYRADRELQLLISVALGCMVGLRSRILFGFAQDKVGHEAHP